MAVDLAILRGRVIDPANDLDAVTDIAISEGRIASVGRAESAVRAIDAEGCDVLPGLVDLHVHCSSEFSGRAAHAMLARAGVTTALDLAGPVVDVMHCAAEHGVGLTLGCLEALIPGRNLSSQSASEREVANVISSAKRAGACGIKVLGGHFPLTPEATETAVAVADMTETWIAVHCGTTTAGSDLEGLEELLRLRGGHPVHVAHLNSYCRGTHSTPAREAEEALRLIAAAADVFSESYVARMNATWGTCVEGIPTSQRTRASLAVGGFEPTKRGLVDAILEGYASVHLVDGDNVYFGIGSEAVRAWREADTKLPVSFPLNDVPTAVAIAAARSGDGSFIVDAWASDGGGIPRNNALSSGYALVRLGVLTTHELVTKTTVAPAAAFGLSNKGQLGVGADADLVVVNRDTGRVRCTVARGEVILYEDVISPRDTAWLTLPEARDAVIAAGLTAAGIEPPSRSTPRSITPAST